MDLNYVLTFGKFRGKSLQYVCDEQSWYLDFLTGIEWLLKKIKSEMNPDDLKYMQTQLKKYRIEKDRRFNNWVVSSYFPSKSWNKDDYSNSCGISGDY